MRYITWDNHKRVIQNIIFFIMGIYIGFFICLYFHGQQLDQLILINDQLNSELKVLKQENEVLNQEKEKRKQNQLIRTVKFNFTEKMDPFSETELLKTLMEETHFLIGKKVDDIGKAPEFVYQLLNGKTFKAKDKSFEIRVKIIYIQSTTEIWVSAKEINTSFS